MTKEEVMKSLASYGNETTKRIYMNHGAREPLFGVKIGDLKKLIKKIKKDHSLALALYKTGNSDAMYLAGLIADEKQMTKKILNEWVKAAYWYMLSEVTVASIAGESPVALECAREWITSKDEMISAAGWSTFTEYISINNDEYIDLKEIETLLQHVKIHIHDAPNRTRYAMNGFVIGVGCFIASLSDRAASIASEIGRVTVFMGNTSCKVPFAPRYIEKVKKRNAIGKKRKTARC